MKEYWYIGFTAGPRKRWFDIFSHKEFRHVLALHFDPVCGVWIYFDVAVNGTFIRVFPAGAGEISCVIAQTARWLKVEVAQAVYPVGLWRFYCVPAVKSLLGVRSCALRPKALYRDLVKAGAVPAFADGDAHGGNI